MDFKFWYMKILGFFITIVGFSYCLTSFFNMFEVLLGNKIVVATNNVWVMCIGLIFPLFTFIFGVFFYFYADVWRNENNKIVLASIIMFFASSIFNILLPIINEHESLIAFIHPSFGYSILIIGIMLIYGKYKYKY